MAAKSLTTGILLASCLLAAAACTLSTPEEKKARHLERGQAYFEKGQYAEALIEFKNVLQIDPKDATGHYRLALTYLKLGGVPNLQAAVGELIRTVELEPSNRDAQLKLGEIYLLARQPAKARERAEALLASAPSDPQAIVLKGQSLIQENELQQGIAELTRAIELDPKRIGVYITLAFAYMQRKEPKSAEAVLNRALTVEPGSTEARVALGDFFVTTGKPDQAEAEYKRALELAPAGEALFLKLAEFYRITGKLAEAEATYKQLVEKKPNEERPLLLLADFYKYLGNRDKALATYQRAATLDPSSVLARNKLIEYDLDLGKLAEAEQLVTPILEKNGKDLYGRFFDARLRLARGKPDEAVALLQGVIKDEPQSAQAHLYLGLAFVQKQDLAQARRELTEAVKFGPNLVEARVALAATHLAEGSSDLAIDEARAALRLNPRHVRAAVILGDAYLRKNDLARSKEVFETFVKVLPEAPLGYYRLGLIAAGENRPKDALGRFEEALTKNPNFVEALAQIVALRLRQGKPEEARDRVARQLAVVPANAIMHDLMGSLWMRAKQNQRAEASFKKAIEVNENLPISYVSLAQLYAATGRMDDAIQEYEAALTKDPRLTPVLTILGMMFEQRKEYEKAQAKYEAALKVNPKFAPAANNLAWILSERDGNIDVALRYAETAHEQTPNDPHVADTLGWIYYKKNTFLRASTLLKEAAEKLPDNPIVLYHYGLVQQKNGEALGAKRSLQAALKLSRTFPGADQARQVLKEL